VIDEPKTFVSGRSEVLSIGGLSSSSSIFVKKKVFQIDQYGVRLVEAGGGTMDMRVGVVQWNGNLRRCVEMKAAYSLQNF